MKNDKVSKIVFAIILSIASIVTTISVILSFVGNQP